MDNASRLYFLGDGALAGGFHLAGFKVFPDADIGTMENLLKELRDARTPALVILGQELAESDSDILQEIQAEGGRILLTQVPPLNRPEELHARIGTHIDQLLAGDET